MAAVRRFAANLKARHPPRPGLGIERFVGHPGVFEPCWAPDGRALFALARYRILIDVHVIGLRIGTHDIYVSQRSLPPRELRRAALDERLHAR